MHIKGEFRDVLKRNGEVIEDRGWKSNTIVPDFGNFLAAVMKKDFKDSSDPPVSIGIGIEYIAVGCGSNKDSGVFKNRVGDFFKNVKPDKPEWNKPYPDDSNPDHWVWAKKIDGSKIKYVSDDTKTVTNMLQIDVMFDNKNPDTTKPLKFEEFALLGFYEPGTATNSETKMFFVNYATHGVITKEKDMTLTRTIKLTFPIT